MDHKELASLLVSQEKAESIPAILEQYSRLADRELAEELKNVCYATWNSEPAKARRASIAADQLAEVVDAPEITAIAAWIRGISALTKGELELAVKYISDSRESFRSAGNDFDAAQATVAMLIPLALLGRYEEASGAGISALEVFEKEGDDVAAGKIEMNLSNIASRKGDHRLAESFGRSALGRFTRIGEAQWRTLAENDLANTLVELNRFREAESQYLKALDSALSEGMSVTEAEIEACLGNLATFRGRYDEALKYLERSRRKFEKSEMPHQTAIAELEMAEIYLTLNLLEEALTMLNSAAKTLSDLKLQGEEARARTNLGRLYLLLGLPEKSALELDRAETLYTNEGNSTGRATVLIVEAKAKLKSGAPEESLSLLDRFLDLLNESDSRLNLEQAILRGEALRAIGQLEKSESILLEARKGARETQIANVELQTTNLLGLIRLDRGNPASAEALFREAVQMTEAMRDPIAAEEFRMAYLSDKLAPYDNLLGICLQEGRIEEAFAVNESARSKTLAEAVRRRASGSSNEIDSELERSKQELREKLNWFYSRLIRAEGEDAVKLQDQVLETERDLAEVSRRIEITRALITDPASTDISVESISETLEDGSGLVEFIVRNGAFSAFVVSSEGLTFVPEIATVEEVSSALKGLRFQFGSMRFGANLPLAFEAQIRKRTDSHLQQLRSLLLDPLEDHILDRDLVIVPSGILNYVPFSALKDGDAYEAEKRVIAYCPGASVWTELARKKRGKFENALLVGFEDEHIPNVNDEIESLSGMFSRSWTFTGFEAAYSAYEEHAGKCEVVHLACHGKFRPDNPMFSSLHLADGHATVRDICAVDLNSALVTLSACETGLSSIYPGNEILGLARGFLTAGATDLVMSLWTVSDAATRELMVSFYGGLPRHSCPAKALNEAQRGMIGDGKQPYHWAPFVTIGTLN
ncbi:MAG: CHAT domain-containing protein [Acidobacteria bacterium]|nr:MAG: CHAT domain-containing protein [Acidobacteriota bacterium]REJ99048.1 MAG: CHAT domain-containing protein [Acidobacteriota bacterium]REK16231.1 MAG: CHAT domain-containing protein [Acidobacteriota bacterium]REK43912.1 MAG: CHAT domain-containing protein [Acidobacteriota bacterium]